MNEDKSHNTHKKFPSLDVESLNWSQDRLAFERVMTHGSHEDKKQLHEMVMGFQRINDILEKVAQRNENKKNSQ